MVTFRQPTITLTPKKKDTSISAQLRRAKSLPLPLRVITSPKTTVVLGSVLATQLLGPAAILRGAAQVSKGVAGTIGKSFLASPIKTSLGLASMPFVVGLATTPEARKFVTGGFSRGRQTPETLKDIITKVEDKTPDIDPLVAAGLGAGAGAGGVVAAQKIKEKVIERFFTEKTHTILEREAGATLPTGVATATGLPAPLGPVQQVPETPVAVATPVEKQKPINIKNVFKPSVDISFKKSKKFINQQVLVK